MARPKLLKTPRALNLSVDQETKRKAFILATKRGKSISQIISAMIEREHAKEFAA